MGPAHVSTVQVIPGSLNEARAEIVVRADPGSSP
jgi:hypothetical protein